MTRPRAIALFAVVAVASAAVGYTWNLWRGRGDASIEAPGGSPGALAEAVFATRLGDLHGGTRTLKEWRGRVLVVNFWATWCAPCREEIPMFVRMQERYGAVGLQFVGIAIDQPEKVADFAREFRINYPLLLGGMETMELVRLAGNRTGVLPYTLVIDRGGSIASRELGGLKEARLDTLIRLLL